VPELKQDFTSAAKRHFWDADYLHKDGRLPTADHLYGFAAECAIKSLLLRFTDVTMEPRPGEEKPSSKPWAEHPDHPEDPAKLIEFGHVNELIREIKLLARGRTGAPLHSALDSDLRAFKKWNVKYRYYDDGYAQTETVDRRRNAARNILVLHERAQIDGKLP
jgi:hypothetical protein